MRLIECLLIILPLLLSVSGEVAFAQSDFQPVDKVDVQKAVADFGANREKFRSFGCAGKVEDRRVDQRQNVSIIKTSFCIFEDSIKEHSRSDWNKVIFQNNQERDNGWATLLKEKDRSRMFASDREMEEVTAEIVMKTDWLPKDPWSWPIIDVSNLRQRKEDVLLWTQIFQEENFLWAEDDGAILRVEWSVGPKSRIQVHFDKKVGNMPTNCRYIYPIDLAAKFAKKSKLFISEIETSWAKHEDGWVPMNVRSYRENLDEGGKLRSTEEWTFMVNWKSSHVRNGEIDPIVFSQGNIPSQNLFEMFSEGTQAKKLRSK